MNKILKNRFSFYESSALTVLFMSDAIIMAGSFTPAGIHSCFSSILSALAASVLLYATGKILIKNVESPVSSVAVTLVSLSAVLISLILFSDFIKVCVLPDINRFIIPFFIAAVAIYAASGIFLTILKSVHIIIPVIIVFIAGIMLLLLPSINLFYLQSLSRLPDLKSFTVALLTDTIVFYVKGFILIYLLKNEKQNIDSNDKPVILKTIISGIIIYGAAIAIIQLVSLAVLGPGLYMNLQYPLYYPPGLTVLGEYFERTEVLTVIMFMASLTIKTAIYFKVIKIAVLQLKDRFTSRAL